MTLYESNICDKDQLHLLLKNRLWEHKDHHLSTLIPGQIGYSISREDPTAASMYTAMFTEHALREISS